MAEEIINRVANSKLITLDLEDYYPKGERLQLDVSQWLEQGFILREKEYRAALDTYNWEQHEGQYIALHCSTDAILPAWAFTLVTLKLAPFALKVIVGDTKQLESIIYTEIIKDLDLSYCEGKPCIIKGCSNKPIPQNAYVLLGQKLFPIAKNIMYGEACSFVPLYKK
ncbi:hypothetical protein SCB49_06877 [unidentified eubacterium SCB49]|nr:hypothetical protein SCB49_06877 [unidentified eubacterium SCB49]